jgi:gamma-glutamyl:cysteine ligase YbdK (ATP-grasp superfamily)
MDSQHPPKPETLSLLEMCSSVSEFKTYNEACREFLFAAQANLAEQTRDNVGQAATSMLPLAVQYGQADVLSHAQEICRSRAEEYQTFAERASDPRVKHLLLELADGYEKIAGPQ